jgi:hypothetical protein
MSVDLYWILVVNLYFGGTGSKQMPAAGIHGSQKLK